MRTLASALMLLTLTNISLADEAVVAHVEVLELSRTRLQELGIKDDRKPMQPLPAAKGSWTFAAHETGARLLHDLEKWRSQNAVRVLGTPTLRMINGTLASFHAGDEMPVPAPGPTSQGTANARKLGLEVELLPKIENAGTISADFHCRYTEALSGQSVRAKGVTVPALSTREVTTHCELKPGQTLVLRGPVQVRSDNARQRGLRLRRLTRSEPEEVELIILLRLESAVASNPGKVSLPVR